MAGMVGQKYNNGSVVPVKIPYGVCPTPANTQKKVATVKGVASLENGLSIRVKFTYAQSYDGAPSLNVNSLGAKTIKLNAATSAGKDAWTAGAVVDFYYDGTNWVQTSSGGNGRDAKTVNGHTVESDVPANAAFTDTTYESKKASSGGTDLSLVTTGEKATWNAKTSNTGTVTKVSTGAGLTGGDITESGTVKANLTSETKLSNAAADGTETAGRVYPVRLDKNGKMAVNVPWTDNNDDTKNTAGSTDSSQKLFLIGAPSQAANLQTYSHDTAYIGTDGALYSEGKKVKTVQTAKSSPSTSGNAVAFIDTISQDANGVITVTKKNVRTFGGATASAAGSTGLVPAPAKGAQKKFLCGDGTWAESDGGKFDVLSNRIGSISTLETDDKTDAVSAINEVHREVSIFFHPVYSALNRWLRFDPENRRGLVIKAGTVIMKSNGTKAYYFTDTHIDLTSQLGTAGANYFLYLNDDGTFTAATTKQANGVYIGRFHTLCASVGSSVSMTMMSSVTSGSGCMAKGYTEDDPDFYNFYFKNSAAYYSGTAYNRVTSAHPLQGFVAGDILPESVCCLTFQPGCRFEDAVVYDRDTDRFIDIYLQSGTAEATRSAYNATHTVNREQINHIEDMRMVGKRLLTDYEFTSAAIGSNEKTNIIGSTDKTTVGGHVDTSNRRMISAIGCEEMCGYLWQCLDEIAPVGGSGWNTYDRDNIFGQNYGTIPYALLAGGDWGEGASGGSRSRYSDIHRSHVSARFGGRGSSRVKRGLAD